MCKTVTVARNPTRCYSPLDNKPKFVLCVLTLLFWLFLTCSLLGRRSLNETCQGNDYKLGTLTQSINVATLYTAILETSD